MKEKMIRSQYGDYSIKLDKIPFEGFYEDFKKEITFNTKLYIITDERVAHYWLENLKKELRDISYEIVILKGYETQKSIEEYQRVTSLLLELGIKRTDAILAFGGGVIGDFAGFISATLYRGISYYSIPTTLLSCVDSSIGGKVAIDFENKKNILGAFYPPKKVWIYTDILDTLPKREISNGMAEVIKMAILESSEFFHQLECENISREELLFSSLSIKEKYIESDELDQGIRAFLNLGHTFGHMYESNHHFEYLHGESVSLGLVTSCKIAEKITGFQDTDRVISLLKKYHLPTDDTKEAKELSKLFEDKKASQDSLMLILPIQIGQCKGVRFTEDELKRVLEWI